MDEGMFAVLCWVLALILCVVYQWWDRRVPSIEQIRQEQREIAEQLEELEEKFKKDRNL
jgi:CHASE3 domain sensor protein